MNWKVQLTDQAIKELKKLDLVEREMIISFLEQHLQGCSDPRKYGKPLHNQYEKLWRYTVGRYRLICELEDGIVNVYLQSGGMLKNLIQTIQEWTYHGVILLVFALFLNVFVVQYMVVKGHSMSPTLQDNEHIIISKLAFGTNKLPDYGDIVIIDNRVHHEHGLKETLSEPINKYTSSPESIAVKRVVGRSGDLLEFRRGDIFRNGVLLNESYILEPMQSSLEGKFVVEENCIFVMGDNRNNSLDSRSLGSIPLDHIIGKLVVKI